MPDTPELFAKFGQPRGQKDGCCFPLTNLAGLFNRSGRLIMGNPGTSTGRLLVSHRTSEEKPRDVC